MARALEERMREREAVIEAVRAFGLRAERVLGPITVLLFGSYARGDFNLWSDVDVLVVVGDEVRLPDKPHRRTDPIIDLIPPGFEVSVVRARELGKALSRSAAVRKALSEAIIVLDGLGLAKGLLARLTERPGVGPGAEGV